MKKGIQLLIVFFILQTIVSCCKEVEFFNFSSFSIQESSLEIATNQLLELEIFPDDLEYTSYLKDFGISQSYALDCDDGWGGAKYEIIDIQVRSNSDFDSTHLKGEYLDDLFVYKVYGDNETVSFKSLTELTKYELYHIDLKLLNSPKMDSLHQFEIIITKENSETLISFSKDIKWVK